MILLKLLWIDFMHSFHQACQGQIYGLSGPRQFIIVKPRSEGYGVLTVGKVQTYDSILI